MIQALFLFILILLNPVPTLAQSMSNSNFILEQGNLNSFSGSATSSNYKVDFSSSNFLSGQYSGQNYTVNPGFSYTQGGQEDAQESVFTFSVTNSSIDFGKITPGEPLIRTTNLTVDTADAPGFLVLVAEESSLRNSEGTEVPDTTCDQGNCTESIASSWSSPLTYGFGYRCDNIEAKSCLSSFSNVKYFKSFANVDDEENSQVLMQAYEEGLYSSQITYKVNIPGTQAPGIYQNIIQYIALPTL